MLRSGSVGEFTEWTMVKTNFDKVRFHVNAPHYAPVVPVFGTHHSGETLNFVFHGVFVGSWALDFSCLRELSS